MISHPGQRPHWVGVRGRALWREAAVLRLLHREAVWDQDLDKGGPSPSASPDSDLRYLPILSSHCGQDEYPQGQLTLQGSPLSLTTVPHIVLPSQVCFSKLKQLAPTILLCRFHLWPLLCLKDATRTRVPSVLKGPYLKCWVHVTAAERKAAEGNLATHQTCVFLGGPPSGSLSMVG